jgi:hypothetical protein
VPKLPSYGPSSHTENCECVRCTGFPPGNRLSIRHGAYSTLHLGGGELHGSVDPAAQVLPQPRVQIRLVDRELVAAVRDLVDAVNRLRRCFNAGEREREQPDDGFVCVLVDRCDVADLLGRADPD